MAVFSGPEIVNDGLVLHLDAANQRSYSGSGTTWNDLSGNGNHGTLVNGPVFNDNVFSFDGSNDYIGLPYNASMDNVHTTLSLWIKSDFILGPRSRHYIFDGLGHKTMLFIDEPRELNFVCIINDNPIYNIYNNITVSENIWCNIVGTYDGSNQNLYFNGNLVSTTAIAGNINSTTTSGRLMDYIGGGYNTEGLANNFMMYNKGISEAEVKQNFEATRSRYGI